MTIETLKYNMAQIHGETVSQNWWDKLPQTLDKQAKKWGFELLSPIETLSYHYLHWVKYKGKKAVLKLSSLNPKFSLEVETLLDLQGPHCVRVLKSNTQALLLQGLTPAQSLIETKSDKEATRIVAELILKTKRPQVPKQNAPQPTLSDWGDAFSRLRERYKGGTGPFESDLITEAESIFKSKNQNAVSVLLHGDLHHENILFDHNLGWVMIDPHGVWGELAFEPSAYLHNQLLKHPYPTQILEERIRIFSDVLSLAPQRIFDWGFAKSVLSVVWSDEDQLSFKEGLTVTQAYQALNNKGAFR